MIEIAYSDRYVLDLPEGHRFPMIKYELVKEQLGIRRFGTRRTH